MTSLPPVATLDATSGDLLQIDNYSGQPFTGWVPCTIHKHLVKHAFGRRLIVAANTITGALLKPVTVEVGQECGDARMIWVKVDMHAGESIVVPTIELMGDSGPRSDPLATLSQYDVASMFAETVNGVPLDLIPDSVSGNMIESDGPAVRTHHRSRFSRLCLADLFLTWVPGEPWARFELVLTCAEPRASALGRPQTTEAFPEGIVFAGGADTVIAYHGQRFGPLLRGESLAQGQARTFSGVMFWPKLMKHDDLGNVGALCVGAPFGVHSAWETIVGGLGVPVAQTGFNRSAAVTRNFQAVLDAAWNWSLLPIGPTPNSGVTGSQEEQCFSAKGTECFHQPLYAGAAAFIRYLVALNVSKRPCHWREGSGDLLDWNSHPNLVLWSGRPHWNTGVSPDQLGMLRLPTEVETHGYAGPDREHWFYGSLWFAAAITGSRACQMEMEAQARLIWFGETTDPALSTSHSDAARSVGWFGIMVRALDQGLRNRETAARVQARAIARIQLVYANELSRSTQPCIWDDRADARLLNELEKHYEDILMADGSIVPSSTEIPPGAIQWRVVFHWQFAWMPYQQAVGAFGMQQLGEQLNNLTAMTLAYEAARSVVDLAYTLSEGGTWKEWEVLGTMRPHVPLLPAQYVEGQGAHSTGWFRFAWLPLALWVVLRHKPDDVRARSIWDQLNNQAAAGTGTLDWMPPLDRTGVA